VRGETIQVKCLRCRVEFTARVADRKRGWGRYCSKSCKAVKQEQKTGQYSALIRSGGPITREERDHHEAMASVEAGWDGHKNAI
jgi:hypothetical protein